MRQAESLYGKDQVRKLLPIIGMMSSHEEIFSKQDKLVKTLEISRVNTVIQQLNTLCRRRINF